MRAVHFAAIWFLVGALATIACGESLVEEPASPPEQGTSHPGASTGRPVPPGKTGDFPGGGPSDSGPRPELVLPDGAVIGADFGPFVPGDAPTSLEAARDRMVGSWKGLARFPGTSPRHVGLTFARGSAPPSGTCASRCFDWSGCLGLHWGSNGSFELEAITADGSVAGWLGLVVPDGGVERATISGLAFDASGNRLRFALTKGTSALDAQPESPLEIDLIRAN